MGVWYTSRIDSLPFSVPPSAVFSTGFSDSSRKLRASRLSRCTESGESLPDAMIS